MNKKSYLIILDDYIADSYLLLLLLYVFFVLGPCFVVMFWCLFWFCYRDAWESCLLALILFLLSCGCLYSVSISRDALGRPRGYKP